MWKRKRLLKWNKIRFGQTFGSAHQESRRLDYTDFAFGMFSRSTKTGNVLSMIESQGFSKWRASAPGSLKLIQYPSGNMYQRLNDTSSRKSVSKRTKGQPEGSAVTGKTRKPGVTEMGLVPNDVTGQNNSNLASFTTLVVYDGWELILVMSSHYCFYTLPAEGHLLKVGLLKKSKSINHKDHKGFTQRSQRSCI